LEEEFSCPFKKIESIEKTNIRNNREKEKREYTLNCFADILNYLLILENIKFNKIIVHYIFYLKIR
jgi:hypothetical protein